VTITATIGADPSKAASVEGELTRWRFQTTVNSLVSASSLCRKGSHDPLDSSACRRAAAVDARVEVVMTDVMRPDRPLDSKGLTPIDRAA